jgi:hypothetical protein
MEIEETGVRALFCFKYLAPCWQPRCHSFVRFRPVALRPQLSLGLPRSARCNMPKRVRRHKLDSTRMGLRPVGTSRTTESVKTLLGRSSHSALGRVAEQRQSQSDWRIWLSSKLPAALAARITGAVQNAENLVIFAESAAWSARLRYAIAELDGEIRRENPALQNVSVRVMPRR